MTALADGDLGRLLFRAGPAGMTPEQARIRGTDSGIEIGDRVIHPEHLDRLRDALVTALNTWHSTHPLSPGAPRRALHTGALAALTEGAFDALISRLVTDNTLEVSGPTARLTGFSVTLDPKSQAAHDRMCATLSAAGLEGERFDLLVQDLDGLLSLLIDQGHATRVGERVISTAILSTLSADIKRFFEGTDRLTPGDFKTLTGLSRRTAIPLLEWLDTQGVTRRDGDARIAG